MGHHLLWETFMLYFPLIYWGSRAPALLWVSLRPPVPPITPSRDSPKPTHGLGPDHKTLHDHTPDSPQPTALQTHPQSLTRPPKSPYDHTPISAPNSAPAPPNPLLSPDSHLPKHPHGPQLHSGVALERGAQSWGHCPHPHPVVESKSPVTRGILRATQHGRKGVPGAGVAPEPPHAVTPPRHSHRRAAGDSPKWGQM